MNSNPLKYIFIVIAVIIILLGTFSGGFLVGQAYPLLVKTGNSDLPLASIENQQTSTSGSDELDALFEPFWETWNYVNEQYVDQPIDQLLMMRGAINGMLGSLDDPHTSYMDPEVFQQQNAPLQGEYEGIGAWVDVSGEFLIIISPMPGSPAEAAGIRPDDRVMAVDGEDMTGIEGNLVLRRILGEAGTDVTLSIYRPSTEETFDVTITRQKITVPSVTGEMLDNNIAYVQLINFGDKTHQDLRKILRDLLKEKPIGLVLDLRNNGGGYLNTAIDVTSEFVSQSPIMIEEFGDGEKITYKAKPNGLATNIPLVVLINEGSASASEITAGAIQDYERGLLVGKTSYGKGSVQNWVTLNNEQGAIRVTIARWLTPNERQINSLGLIPDIEIEITEEDFAAEKDTQLEKAIELLLNE
ncbi:MAG TPA: S41 family peptidase [Anaerolineaceae bacterium]|nr:S41 family peptidase [Anaerolineaceae bacterium]